MQQGPAAAQFELANRMFAGVDAPLNRAEALAWYRVAAGASHLAAQMKLGELYDSGNGVERNAGEGQSGLIIGKPGTGKSHVANAVAYQAILQGHHVRYLEADSAFAQYALGSEPEQRQQLRALLEADLLVLDDLFLARRIGDKAVELLQAVVHQRYKQRCSILVTANRVVQDWGKYLGDTTMAITVLDRLMHRAHILEFEGKSYRLKEAAARLTRPASLASPGPDDQQRTDWPAIEAVLPGGI